MGKNKGYTAWPRASAICAGRRVFLGRFATREERDAAVRAFRVKYPDQRKKRVSP